MGMVDRKFLRTYRSAMERLKSGSQAQQDRANDQFNFETTLINFQFQTGTHKLGDKYKEQIQRHMKFFDIIYDPDPPEEICHQKYKTSNCEWKLLNKLGEKRLRRESKFWDRI